MKFEDQKCSICGCDEYKFYLEVPNRFNLDERFNLVQCVKCGFVFLNPRPSEDEIGKYYEAEDYQPHQLERKTILEQLYNFIRTRNNRYKRKLIERFVEGKSVLDYGCGSGEFLLEMFNSGWQVSGVEPAQKPREFANEQNLNVHNQIDQITDRFNVITLWHVLEHVYDLQKLIGQLKERLQKDGILVLALPNLKSYDAQKYNSSWVAYDAPRHVSHFCPGDIERLFTEFGFRIIAHKTLFVDTWFNVLFSWQLEGKLKEKSNMILGFLKFKMVALISTLKETIDRFSSSSVIYILKEK
jgi:2-polyprenyl-3-methyl-5-hydroxy-6-metoxy-1,4-benzoquinol methylase